MLAMTQLCGLEARIEGMTVALQAIDHDQTCKSLYVSSSVSSNAEITGMMT